MPIDTKSVCAGNEGSIGLIAANVEGLTKDGVRFLVERGRVRREHAGIVGLAVYMTVIARLIAEMVDPADFDQQVEIIARDLRDGLPRFHDAYRAERDGRGSERVQ